jgi:hypothetical protein
MKQIYKEITARLEEEVRELKWIDMDKNQMTFSGTAVLFPAALVTISWRTTQDISDTIQNKDLLIQVKLCFDFSGNTNTKTPLIHRDRSLEYYDIVEKVDRALQGWCGSVFNPLSSVQLAGEKRPDAYKVETLAYRSSFRSDTAKED